MDLNNEEVIYSSEKCKITKGEYNGKQCIKKVGSFSREAINAIARINSPYIPYIYKVGDDYIISEYADGSDLSTVKISSENVIDIAFELCNALGELHKNDVIHRDIKPSNIILGNDGHIKLIDFDAARIKKATVDKDTVFIGTDGFAPPEQFGFTQTDERSDIYAFGVTIKLLLGENFKRVSYKNVIEKCMRFNPEQRYVSIKTVGYALLFSRVMPILGSVSAGAALIAVMIVLLNSMLAPNEISVVGNSSGDLSEKSSEFDTTSENESNFSETSSSAFLYSESVSDSVSESNSSSYPDFPMDDERFYSVSWDMLSLPEGFPRLSDKVTHFYFTNGYSGDTPRAINITWNVMTEEETFEIVQKLHEWMGMDSNYYVTSNGDYITEWRISNDDYDVHITWGVQALSYTWVTIRPQSDDKFPAINLAQANPTVTNYGKRYIKWEEADALGFLPKLTDAATEMECSNNIYEIQWDFMRIEELEAVIQKIIVLFDDEYTVTENFHSAFYLWELNGKMNGVDRKINIQYVTKYHVDYGKWPQVYINAE